MERYQDKRETEDSVATRQMSFSRWYRLWFMTVLVLKTTSLKFPTAFQFWMQTEKKQALALCSVHITSEIHFQSVNYKIWHH